MTVITNGESSPIVGFADLATFQKRLVDGIKGAFGAMIPDEALQKIVEAEWKKFAEGYDEKDRWNNPTKRVEPELPRLVGEEIRRQVLVKIQEWGKEWGKGAECDRLARETIETAARVAAETWHANLGHSILQQVMSSMPSVYACKNCGCAGVRRDTNCPQCGQYQR